MSSPSSSPINIHASCVARPMSQGWCAILLLGESGAGKSDLALRLIDRGAKLVADDRSLLWTEGGALLCAPPPTLQGRMEIRGLGIMTLDWIAPVPLVLAVSLADSYDRMPPPIPYRRIADHSLPTVTLSACESSAAIKIEMALAELGVFGESPMGL